MSGFWGSLGPYSRILLLPFLVLRNAFFVATDSALVSVRRPRLEEMASKRIPGVSFALGAVDRLDDMMAATQLGITMTSLALGWIGEPALAHVMVPWFRFLPAAWGPVAAHTAATVVAFAGITFLHVVAGELAPRTIAIRIPDRVVLALAPPLLFFERLLRPFIVFTSGVGMGLTRLLGFEPAEHAQHVHSVHELQLLVEDVSEAGRMTPDHAELLKNAFRLPEKKVRESMVPLKDAVMVEYRLKP